jgi:hypothetical protein
VCRVSMQKTGKPALASPSNSHWDKGPASTPTLSKLKEGSLRIATSLPGEMPPSVGGIVSRLHRQYRRSFP